MAESAGDSQTATNSEIRAARGGRRGREALLRDDTPLALFLVFTLIFAIAASLMGVAFKIEGFPYRELMGISALLVLVVWAGQRSLAAIAILVLAATIMPENLFRSTQGVFFGILGQASQSAPGESVETQTLDALYKEGESRLDEVDQSRFLQTARLLRAVALATPDDIWLQAELAPPPQRREADPALELENLAGLALRGLAQAEVLRLSAWYLSEANLIDCATASGFEQVANSEGRRLRLSSELESCTATRPGLQYIDPSLEQTARTEPVYAQAYAPAQGLNQALIAAPAETAAFEPLDVPPAGAELSRSLAAGQDGEITLQIQVPATYVIGVTGETGQGRSQDPRIALYEGADGALVGRDDDGGAGLNARLSVPLCPGGYTLIVDEFFDRPLDFTVRITRNLDAAAPPC